MQKTISIKSTSGKSLWTKFINDNRFAPGVSEVVFDFSECFFVEPFHVVLLACLIEEYYLNGVNIIFLPGENLALRQYLTTIHFFEYWDNGFNREDYTQNTKMTNLCLWKLNPPRLTPYVNYAQHYFETNFLQEKSVDPLNITLAELFNNIIDHANSPVTGYTTSQFYPILNKMKVAICDFGTGIPFKINTFLQKHNKPVLLPHDALRIAFEKAFSTKSSPQNRGFGLDTLRAIIKMNNGTLRVVSNDAMMIMDNHRIEFFTIRHNFQGTHFDITLDTSTFDEKEFEMFTDDFTF